MKETGFLCFDLPSSSHQKSVCMYVIVCIKKREKREEEKGEGKPVSDVGARNQSETQGI